MGSKYKHNFNDTPGPGYYNANDSPIKSKVKNSYISPTKSFLNKINDNPGPGSYDVRDSKGKGGPGFGSKYKHAYNDTPGPGYYEADKS